MRSDVDGLYGVPLAEFTARRNELAARLRAAGRRDDAAAVGRLKRPSVPVWAINTLAREDAGGVRALVEATDRLRRAQAGDRAALVEATEGQRRTLQGLVRASEAILRRAGVRPNAQTLERISRTLRGASVDRDARRALLAGRLAEEREAPGFEALAGVSIARAARRATEHPVERPRRPASTRPADDRRAQAAVATTRPADDPRAQAAVATTRPADDPRAQAAVVKRRAAEVRAEELAAQARALEETAGSEERKAADAQQAVTDLRRRLREAVREARERARSARSAAAAATRARREAARAAAAVRTPARDGRKR